MFDLQGKMNEFYQRWDIDRSTSPDKEFKKLKRCCINALTNLRVHLTEDGVEEFCAYFGQTRENEDFYSGVGALSKNVITALRDSEKLDECIEVLQVAAHLPLAKRSGFSMGQPEHSVSPWAAVSRCVKYSNLDIAVDTKGKEVTFYPEGEEVLDEELVNKTLKFLNDDSDRHFRSALTHYHEGGQDSYVDAAEDLRRSAEEFLRHKLDNEKGLKKNIKVLKEKLGTKGKEPHARKIVTTTFSYLDKHYNETSKHNHEEFEEEDIEFLIYQTGTLLRFIDKSF